MIDAKGRAAPRQARAQVSVGLQARFRIGRPNVVLARDRAAGAHFAPIVLAVGVFIEVLLDGANARLLELVEFPGFQGAQNQMDRAHADCLQYAVRLAR